MKNWTLLFLVLLSFACVDEAPNEAATNNAKYMLELLSETQTNIDFKNTVIETPTANSLVYEYLYNGSGVALGDINNDGLVDIYFGGNTSDDKLYLNEGDFKFKDISSVLDLDHLKGWTTGINMVDINSDGWLDIYVCRSGPNSENLRVNKLFINNGDLTFTEDAAAFNLDMSSYSIQSAFFDYDLDGDLDMYLLNHPDPGFKAQDFYTHVKQINQKELQTDFFFENENGKFVDKTITSGLKSFGFRNGIAIGDVNHDQYPDLYISSDFDEPDLFFINNKNKTFSNVVDDQLKHISFQSMGNEFADINNDGLLDLFVLDMAPNNHFRSKVYMKSMDVNKFHAMSDNGFHYQYMQNTLQLNNGNNSYSEIAQLSGIGISDWSWAPLFFDIDLDGHKDLFVTNGIKENFLYNDLQSDIAKKQNELQRSINLEELLELVPTDITKNNLYKNNGDLNFDDVSNSWLSPEVINSNGAAYADLDNDGDLDLVVNNMDEVASVYQNNVKDFNTNKHIKISFSGPDHNKFGLGAKVYVTTNGITQFQEFQTTRGHLSSVGHSLVFGLNDASTIDKLKVVWPDNKVSEIHNVKTNSSLVINYNEATTSNEDLMKMALQFNELDPAALNLSFVHQESDFDDFSKQVLLPHKQSVKGPDITVGDVNNDGLDDVYIAGGSGQSGKLFIQIETGEFNEKYNSVFNSDKDFEDNGVQFFDADNDGDLDLYIASGSYELNEGDALLQDRLYTNDGSGNFSRYKKLPEMLTVTKAIKPFDYDGDGDFDLLVGGTVVPGKYPLTPRSYLLENSSGAFKDVTDSQFKAFRDIGMVSAIEVTDYNNDGNPDVVIVGSWMPITIFSIMNQQFVKQDIAVFNQSQGWHQSLAIDDFDGDGDQDFVIGNFGLNNKFHPAQDKPLHIFSKDFDNNGSYDMALSKTYKGQLVPVRGKECSTEQTPYLSEKIGTYQEFASLDIENIYGEENISSSFHKQIYNLASLYVENNGNGTFSISELPVQAQFGPTKAFLNMDVNNDGHLDIIGVGNHYDAEVETIRYDANQGYVLLGNGLGEFTPLINSGFAVNKDSRAMAAITISGKPHLIVASNNDSLSLFKIN